MMHSEKIWTELKYLRAQLPILHILKSFRVFRQLISKKWLSVSKDKDRVLKPAKTKANV